MPCRQSVEEPDPHALAGVEEEDCGEQCERHDRESDCYRSKVGKCSLEYLARVGFDVVACLFNGLVDPVVDLIGGEVYGPRPGSYKLDDLIDTVAKLFAKRVPLPGNRCNDVEDEATKNGCATQQREYFA